MAENQDLVKALTRLSRAIEQSNSIMIEKTRFAMEQAAKVFEDANDKQQLYLAAMQGKPWGIEDKSGVSHLPQEGESPADVRKRLGLFPDEGLVRVLPSLPDSDQH